MATSPTEIESKDALLAAVRRTEALILSENYRGYDPYDALTSPLFRLPLLRSNRFVRRGAQQVFRRIPFNMRPALGIRKGLSPVTLGLVLQAWASLADAFPDEREDYETSGAVLVSRLDAMSTPGWSGACWGYDFDWETRDGPVPPARRRSWRRASSPTGSSSRPSRSASRRRDPFAKAPAPSSSTTSSAQQDRTAASAGHTPPAIVRVFSTRQRRGRGCWRRCTRRRAAKSCARPPPSSLRYVALHQRPDGSWPYAVDDPRTWSDNFHTGYVLDAFAEYRARTGDTQFDDVAEHGWRHYREHFFDNDIDPALLRHGSVPTRRDRLRAVAD